MDMWHRRLETPGSSLHSRRQVLSLGAGCLAVAGLGRTAVAVAATSGAPLTQATFAPFINENFLFDNGEAQTWLRLMQIVAQPRAKRPSGLRDPFSLIFSSPWQKLLTAQTYDVRLPNNGRMTMFLTPVSANPYRYEAPFN